MSATTDLGPLEALLGREFEFEAVEEMTRNDIRRKLEVYCSDCPIHYDDEVARRHGYAGVVAPTTMAPLLAPPGYWHPGDPLFFAPEAPFHGGWLRMEELQAVFAKGVNVSSEWEYRAPLYPGDHLRGVWSPLEITPKTTRLGEGAFLTYELKLWKQTGELVAINRNTNFQYNPAPAPATGAPETPPPVAADVVPYKAPPLTTPDFDWSVQRFLEDVKIGDDLDPYVLWLTAQRIVMGISCDRMFYPVHFDREAAREMGLDDIIFNTRGYEGAYEVMLRRFMGLDGHLVKLGPFKMGKNAYPGDTLAFHGRVTAKALGDGVGFVDLEVWVESNRGETSRGAARVSLPLRRSRNREET